MDKKRSKLFYITLGIFSFNVLLMVVLGSFLFLSLSDVNFNNPINNIPFTPDTDKRLSDLPPDFDILVEAWQMLNKDYVDKDNLDAEKLGQGAVRGMIKALDDPHSAYVNPQLYKLEMSSLKGKYQGIGAYVGVRNDQLTIIAPIAGSPAEKAGLKAGDRILEIDGVSTSGLSVAEAALTIQGPAGTPVILTVHSEDSDKPVEIEIFRGEITIKSVHWEKIDNVAYIRLTSFLQNTGNEFSEALKDIANEKVDGIILDLRNNPGGLLNVSVDIASQFISDGIVVDVVDSNGVHSPIKARSGGLALDLPLILLVNGGSASGSEVLAGAVQDYSSAKLAGKQTYGKGSVQIIRNLKDDSAVHLTIARWFTPLGRPIQDAGLTPEYELDLEGEELIQWAVDYLNGKTVSYDFYLVPSN
jgi:carboxyl-terminal processing protease